MNIETVVGDITHQQTDAIVNAANAELVLGSGVNGAIHRAAGPELLAACRQIGVCHTGNAVITPAFDLPCRYVIHAVGPVWHGGHMQEALLLRSCYRKCLEIANDYEMGSVSFPAISTGVYGYPGREAAQIAVNSIREFGSVDLVRFVCFDDLTLQFYESALAA